MWFWSFSIQNVTFEGLFTVTWYVSTNRRLFKSLWNSQHSDGELIHCAAHKLVTFAVVLLMFFRLTIRPNVQSFHKNVSLGHFCSFGALYSMLWSWSVLNKDHCFGHSQQCCFFFTCISIFHPDLKFTVQRRKQVWPGQRWELLIIWVKSHSLYLENLYSVSIFLHFFNIKYFEV